MKLDSYRLVHQRNRQPDQDHRLVRRIRPGCSLRKRWQQLEQQQRDRDQRVRVGCGCQQQLGSMRQFLARWWRSMLCEEMKANVRTQIHT